MRRFMRWIAITVVAMGVVGAAAGGSYVLWLTTRPQPEPITQQVLFEGIRYSREVTPNPEPMVAHIVTVDLTQPHIQAITTPPGSLDDYVYTARTVSQFAAELDLQLAVNGDFFYPWFTYTPWHYYPHTGDGVNVRGTAIYNGQPLTLGDTAANYPHRTLYLYDDYGSFQPTDPPQQAISGDIMLVVDGEPQSHRRTSYIVTPHPRTAVGLSADGKTLFLFVVDGRQPNYSVGASIDDLTALALAHGAHNVMNLDGGGSSALVAEVDGKLQVLNSPIHGRIPGTERSVANHLGLKVR